MSVAVVSSAVSGFLMDWLGISWVYVICAIIKLSATCATLWIPEKREKVGLSVREFWRHLRAVLSMFLNKPFLKLALFIFVSDFNIGLYAPMLYWYDDVAHYSKGFLGIMGTISYVIALVFVIVYATFLKNVRFRAIFIFLQVMQAAISSLDIILVTLAKDAYWVRSQIRDAPRHS